MTYRLSLMRGVSFRPVFSPDEGGAAPAPVEAPAAAAPEPSAPAVDRSNGGLSIEQATQALMEPKYEVLDEPADEPAAAAPEQITEGGDQSPSEPTEEAPAVAPDAGAEEGQEPTQEPVAALEAPAYWSRDAKAEFAKLSPEMQAVVLAQEGPRETATAKAKADAQAAIQASEERGKGVQQLAEQLATALPEWINTFQQRWGEPDWEATARQYGAEQAFQLKARYDREAAQIQQAQQAATQARTEAQQAYVQREWGELAKLDPVLAPDVRDPTKGAQERQKVTKYLLDTGIGRDAVAQISAIEMTMARKAMLWDEAQKAAKGVTPAQPKPPAAKPGARPSATPAGSPAQRSVQSVQGSFNARPTIDNAVALLMARSGQR